MKIFDKRPLCMILCILLGGFVFFTSCPLYVEIPILSIAVISLLIVIFWNNKRLVQKPLIILVCIFIILASLLSFFYYDCYFNVYELYDERVEITGRVTKATEGTTETYIELTTDKINGKNVTYKLSASVPTSTAYPIEKNDIIKFYGYVSDFEISGDFDMRTYMRSRGFSGEITEIKSFEVLAEGTPDFFERIISYRDSLSDWITENSGDEGGGLLCALILGDRSKLPFQAELNFQRTGLSHLLALSGLHLSIIVFGISTLLSALRINKKIRKVVEIIFVILYVVLTGAPISVVRAGLMVIISALIFLFSARSDSITTLSLSVIIICVAMPYSIYDVSLWLSAFATLGVLVYSELHDSYQGKSVGRLRKFITDTVSGVVISFFAIAATAVFTNIFFGTVSTVGALATPIISLIVTPFMYLGLIFMMLGNVLGFGYIINGMGALILNVVKSFSSISWIYLLAENAITQVLTIVLAVMFFLFLILDVNKKKAALITLLGILLSIYASAFSFNLYNTTADDIQYIQDENDDYVLIKSRAKTAIIDVTDQSTNDTYKSVNLINDAGLTELDSYIYTNYTFGLDAAAIKLANNIYVKHIYIPEPVTDEERITHSVMESVLYGSNTSLHTYSSDEFINIGEYSLILPYRSLKYDKNAFLIFDENDRVTTYVSSGMLNDDTKSVAVTLINGCDTLIFGRHGTSYSDYNFIIKFNGIKRIILSSENMTLPEEMVKYYSNTEILEDIKRISIKH